MGINIKFKNLRWLVISILLSFSLTNSVLASDQKKIKTHDPDSKIIINYENLTLLYQATVTRPRTSSRKYAAKARPGIGTKVNYSSSRPTRLEASRVFFHQIGKEEQESVHMLRLGMESLPDVIPLHTLNRNEQLAYWLNLYNLTVYDEIAKRYPISKLKKLYNGTSKTPSLWDEKIININGINISLNDIQYNIIQKSWHNPLVMYGLYQGTIGGPNLRRKAFTGKKNIANSKIMLRNSLILLEECALRERTLLYLNSTKEAKNYFPILTGI